MIGRNIADSAEAIVVSRFHQVFFYIQARKQERASSILLLWS